ncbi:hypothetical protein SAMN05421835_110178 [Amycolatopsis sacchari]|uniref:DUF2637 domain-containing protein n=1 Tax=Amycolatopsis sacchari TaxID=115433 RepID=A0A1I3V6K9_9PSEU|nr:hypothetical protein [Amycolatopsis sacchari]SFJ91194.1 hypothetical protein SAMN05421835_110178 [Amycolatopsis sacchari]
MNWREERRADRIAEAQIRREEAAAQAQVRIAEQSAAAQQRRADEQARAEARRAEQDRRRGRRAARMARIRTWTSAHAVDLLIYPLALVSAVLAVPAMAAYGHQVYGNATGYALFCITELGMWAFALAVQITRHRNPERPVWALQLGVWAFAAVAFGVNALHGAERGFSPAVVMGIGSIAGVLAHQLITAGHLRSRLERTQARIERQAARKVARVQRTAVRQAVAEIATDGTARLVYAPGRYVIARSRVTRRPRLEAAIVPGLPTGESADWDRELADLLATHRPSIDPTDGTLGTGPVATLDPDPEQQKSTPNRSKVGGRPSRTIAQLRAELKRAMKARPGSIDPTSAESIRKALRCSPARARQLRDEHRQGGTK